MPKTFLYSVNPIQMSLSAAAHVWRELQKHLPPPIRKSSKHILQ